MVQESPVLSQAGGSSLKRVVAIARFTDETKRNSSIFLDENNNKVGKQASDILAARLASTKKLILLERESEALLLKENDDAKARARYLIVGSVSEYGRSNKSDVGIFSRNRIQSAYSTVNVRLIDTLTGEIVYSEEGKGEATSESNKTFGVGQTAGYDQSLDDKSLSAAISKLISNLVENLLDLPWQSYLLANEPIDVLYMMVGGRNQGLEIGQVLSLHDKSKTILNPQSGLKITLKGKKISDITVLSFAGKGSNEISFVRIEKAELKITDAEKFVIYEGSDK
jgi:curli biogenesis system outer membrane secretion channel CsgG